MKPLSQVDKLILSVLIIVLIGIIGWVVWPMFSGVQKPTNTNVSNTNTRPTNLNTSVDTSNWQTYRNEELGFEVKIPPSWKDYKISMKETTDGLGSVSFARKTNKISGGQTIDYYTLMAITLVTHDGWEKELSYDQPHPGVLKSSVRGVYTFNIGQDLANQQEYDDVQGVIQTFNLLVD